MTCTDEQPQRPPRLQHSPSLPNIWFPPHCGPIPPQLAEISRESLVLPLTPSVPKHSLPENQSTARKVPRRRPAHDLLTPPLTPSSSIRTTTSGLSVDTDSGEHPQVTGEGEEDEASAAWTRFLLVRNVSRTSSSDMLNATFLASLSSANLNPLLPSSAGLNLSTRTPGIPDASDTPIKGVFVRFQQTLGIIIIAFFDVRYAQAAKNFLSTRSTGALDQCVEQDTPRPDDAQKAWLDPQFVSTETIVKMVGDSVFLKSSVAHFLVTVEGTSAEDKSKRRDINLTALKGLVKNYGGVRSFKEQSLDEHSKTFYIEYYDIRDSNAAYDALDNAVCFGMELKVSGRDDHPDRTSDEKHSVAADNTPDEDAVPKTFKAAGSSHRERFVFPDKSGKSSTTATPSNSENEQQTVDPPSAPSIAPSSASPTYFYTSSPPSELPKGPEFGKAVPVNGMRHLTIDPYHASPTSDGSQYCPPMVSPSYAGVPQDCYYYASPTRDSPTTPGGYMGHPYYPVAHGGAPTSFPVSPHNVVYPGSPPLVGLPYEFDPEHAQTMNWTYDQAMMTGMRPYPPQGYPPGSVSPTEYWNMISPTAAHQSYFHHQAMMPYVSSPTAGGTIPSPVNTRDAAPATAPVVFTQQNVKPPSPTYATPTIPSTASVPSTITAATPRSTTPTINKDSSASDRNQLKLDKIEEGLDTRTTVMIKNIPNKMSDKDLISFISKVCPRKIDFLYLRMDFKNGCNVGYAFVNFITVEDLLWFAKKKLGQKWNMFSSEKVLQMSYANYQGKEALVEKFKNSCIMDEREAWQPKIFYSEPGPEQGLPEPFPAPTHLRRKERSSHNRGALFVPNNSGGTSSGTYGGHHQGLRRRHEIDDRRNGEHGDRSRPPRVLDEQAPTFVH